ncbi:MAG TPA: isoprenylcysteine carboxylmethyltransferase family protein [Myxococcota bacterium]|nr:isoprenylcysteine carboxylmethyltransferase family protein [Myxococcota bacterium]
MELVRRIGALAYGVICYAIFFVTFLYFVGFVGNFLVPKSIDSGPVEPLGFALAVDAALLALFGVQHSVMARPGWKRWFTRLVPRSIERSSYVLASSAAVIVLCWQWRPIPTPLFELHNDVAVGALTALSLLGYALVLEATLLIDHFDLFGLRQVYLRALGRPFVEKKEFMTPQLYKYIRHPLYVGWFVALWATPVFSVGHLLLASALTSYILIAIPFEERDLAEQLGEPYLAWRERTPPFVPRFGRSSRPGAVRVREEAR